MLMQLVKLPFWICWLVINRIALFMGQLLWWAFIPVKLVALGIYYVFIGWWLIKFQDASVPDEEITLNHWNYKLDKK